MSKKEFFTDGQLINQFLQGNDFAFEQLITRHKQKVFTSVYLIVNDRYLAEDIFQESFIKALHFIKAGSYTHEDKFSPWIIRIAKNKAFDALRSKKVRPVITDSEENNIFNYLVSNESVAESNLILNDRDNCIKKSIHQLPCKQKEVLILRHYAELSFKEISELTGTNVNTCIGRMHYALNNLKKMLDKNLIHLQ